jgi:formate dehydrogenase subunit gamma
MATPKKPKIMKNEEGEILVERFSPIRRFEHHLVALGFIMLILTGLPQKFHGPVSAWILGVLGGLDTARFIHRFFGLVFVFHALAHLGSFVLGTIRGTMRPTLVPTFQDLRDARDNLLYYFGFRAKPPAMPKFDYRQKFEYMGLVLGGLVMILSGLILLFPKTTAGFLPGEVIPVAQMLHTNEAMLALLVLVVWHVYGSVLSPDVFPLDTSVFTGYMTAEELKHHHRLEYDRLFPDDAPERHVENAPVEEPPPPRVASNHG